MTKKEYIANLENLIINRVKYHSPRVSEEIDYALLDAVGIDGKYPVFIFTKPLDKVFYQAFFNAKKKAEFNLILTCKPDVSLNKVKALPITYVIYQEELSSQLGRVLDQLNINYPSKSDFKHEIKGEQLKINGKQIDFDYMPYCYYKKFIENGVVSDIKSFVLNGKNYLLNFSNSTAQKQSVEFEFFLPLPRGYYLFKYSHRCIEIENLTSKQKAYFNYNFPIKNLTFSSMTGIESCTFACIRLSCKLELLPKENRKIYFNFGENKYCLLNPKEMNLFYEISQRKMNEIFDMKIVSHKSSQDELFNRSLPRKIWEKWQNFDVDEESENLYLKMRKQLINNGEEGLQISKEYKGLKEVKFFRNNRWKRVFIVHNNACYLFADRVKYFNYTLLTKEIFNKNNEIYLSFND